MIKRVAKALITCLALGVFLTGCGSQFPKMTDDEYNQTVQYMVSLLMKYSNNGVEKLSSLSALELQYQMEKEDREAKKAARDKALEEALANQANNPDADTSESGDTTSDDSDNKQSADNTDIAQNDTSNPDIQEDRQEPYEQQDNIPQNSDIEEDISQLIAESEDDLNEGLQNPELDLPEEDNSGDESSDESIPADIVTGDDDPAMSEADKVVEGMRQELSKGMFLTYSGYSVATTYPDNDDVFVIHATDKKKLLILNFRLVNTSGMDVSVDMVKANPHFQVILNGINVGYTNVTMLDNDLSSYKGSIAADEKKSMVLIKQMDADKLKNVSTLGLIGDMGGEIIEFKLE